MWTGRVLWRRVDTEYRQHRRMKTRRGRYKHRDRESRSKYRKSRRRPLQSTHFSFTITELGHKHTSIDLPSLSSHFPSSSPHQITPPLLPPPPARHFSIPFLPCPIPPIPLTFFQPPPVHRLALLAIELFFSFPVFFPMPISDSIAHTRRTRGRPHPCLQSPSPIPGVLSPAPVSPHLQPYYPNASRKLYGVHIHIQLTNRSVLYIHPVQYIHQRSINHHRPPVSDIHISMHT